MRSHPGAPRYAETSLPSCVQPPAPVPLPPFALRVGIVPVKDRPQIHRRHDPWNLLVRIDHREMMHPVTEHLTCGVYDRHDAVHGHDRSGHAFTDLTLLHTGRQELFETFRPGTPLDVVSCFF